MVLHRPYIYRHLNLCYAIDPEGVSKDLEINALIIRLFSLRERVCTEILPRVDSCTTDMQSQYFGNQNTRHLNETKSSRPIGRVRMELISSVSEAVYGSIVSG